MPFITAKKIAHVTHIGHLDNAMGRRAPGRDGPGIAVSTEPETWRRLHGLNGPEWVLSWSPAQWVDALALDQEDIEELKTWMRVKRYFKPCTAWAIDWVTEAGEWQDGIYPSLEEACRVAGISLEDEVARSLRNEGQSTEIDHFRLEKRAIKRLGGWPDPLNWYDAAIILYTREVIMEKRPFVVGIWWDEAESEGAKSASYGVLFPERVSEFSVENEDGDDMTFAEAFPEFDIPEPPEGDSESFERRLRKMQAEEKALVEGGMSPTDAARRIMALYYSL